jgi:hypothetical protein
MLFADLAILVAVTTIQAGLFHVSLPFASARRERLRLGGGIGNVFRTSAGVIEVTLDGVSA